MDAMLAVKNGDFFLVVDGDSMIGDGILDGDRVLVRPNVDITNGQIAAVQVEGVEGTSRATLKHFHAQPTGTHDPTARLEFGA